MISKYQIDISYKVLCLSYIEGIDEVISQIKNDANYDSNKEIFDANIAGLEKSKEFFNIVKNTVDRLSFE